MNEVQNLKKIQEIYDTVMIQKLKYHDDEFKIKFDTQGNVLEIYQLNILFGKVFLSTDLLKLNVFDKFEIGYDGDDFMYTQYDNKLGVEVQFILPITKDEYFNVSVQDDIIFTYEEICELTDNYIPLFVHVYGD